jgi:tRNA G46 methylase TrmB
MNTGITQTPLQYWLSSEGVQLLASAKELLTTHHNDTLRAGNALRKQFPNTSPNLAAQALDLTLLREKAASFGVWTQHGFFTRQSLEQATTPVIALHHAQRFAGCKHVVEICTGAGFDTAALAQCVGYSGGRVTTIEANAELAAMAQQNLAAQNIHNVEVVCGLAEDILQTLDTRHFDGLWCDPSRRDERGRRIANPNDYAPSLEWLQRLSERLNGSGVAGIKISPAANLEYDADWQREWIGYGNECREQTLWRRVQLVDGSASLPDVALQWSPPTQRINAHVWNKPLQILEGQYLVEPHGCLIRGGYLSDFFAERNILLLDEHIAYGTALHEPTKSAWYQTFRIVETFDFHRARLRERVAARGWGNSVEIKKRGFPETPDEIRKWLKLPSSKNTGTLIITRVGVGHLVMLAERM